MDNWWSGFLWGLVFAFGAWPFLLKPILRACAWVVVDYVTIRRNGIGIHLRDCQGWTVFLPCTKEARAVLRRQAEKIKAPRYRFGLFGAFWVPGQRWRNRLYEMCSHDADNPQCMSQDAKLGVRVVEGDF
jgi:hypothetical protein